MKYLQNKLKEDEKTILQQLESLTEEELKEASHEMPREIQFQPLMPGQNLLGVVGLDGVLPSHLSLSLLSQLADLREGASLRLEVAATRPGLGDSWQRRLVVTAVLQGEDGAERSLSVQRETKAGKVLLGFKAGLGVHSVSVLLYGQDILSSPFIIPVQAEPEKILAEVGLCFRGRDRTLKVRLNSTTRDTLGFNFDFLFQAESCRPKAGGELGGTRHECAGGGGGVKQEVLPSSLEKAAATLPRAPQCSLCLKDARKAMELVCDGSTVCWGCAVKVKRRCRRLFSHFFCKTDTQEINKKHICWECSATNISTTNHLRHKRKAGLRKPVVSTVSTTVSTTASTTTKSKSKPVSAREEKAGLKYLIDFFDNQDLSPLVRRFEDLKI